MAVGRAASGAATGAAAGSAILPGWGTAIGGVIGGLNGAFGGDPYAEAAKKAREYYERAQAQQQPYNQFGQDQISKLGGAENNLLDPTKLQSDWESQYTMSPHAQQLQEQAKTAGLDAASSQGLLGSSASNSNIQQGASNIMNADREQYMNDLMEKYKTGIGLGQNIYGTGANTAANMGAQTVAQGNTEGGAAYGSGAQTGNDFRELMNNAMKAKMAGGYNGGQQFPAYLGN